MTAKNVTRPSLIRNASCAIVWAVVTWEWDEAAGRKGFEQAKTVLKEVEADPSGRLPA